MDSPITFGTREAESFGKEAEEIMADSACTGWAELERPMDQWEEETTRLGDYPTAEVSGLRRWCVRKLMRHSKPTDYRVLHFTSIRLPFRMDCIRITGKDGAPAWFLELSNRSRTER